MAPTKDGIYMSPGMEKELKKLGISTKDLLKIPAPGSGSPHFDWKGKQVKKKKKKKTRVA
tara:strand:- start:261 stop:440 length:180 start_codon:yes stop_codon:yes gene_type:complete